MGVVVFLVVCSLVACMVAGGWLEVGRRVVRVVDRWRHPAVAAGQPAPEVRTGPQPSRPAPPTLADLEFPTPAPAGPSKEGRLVAALLAGAVSPEQYHKTMHVLAAHDERVHPLPPVPS